MCNPSGCTYLTQPSFEISTFLVKTEESTDARQVYTCTWMTVILKSIQKNCDSNCSLIRLVGYHGCTESIGQLVLKKKKVTLYIP